MNSHAYLAKQLLKISENTNDNTVKIQAIMRCIEEIATYKYNLDDSSQDYKKMLVATIRNDKELYHLYSQILDIIFYYLLGEEVKIDDIKKKVEEIVNQIKEI